MGEGVEKIVLATRNKGKIAEFSALLAGLDIEVLGLDAFDGIGDIEETGDSFEENALIKARAVAAAPGLTAVADDSGISVDHLGGAPGVFSARYAGEHGDSGANNAKLLAELAGVPDGERGAAFVCVMAAVRPDGREMLVRGEWRGRIGHRAEGRTGFGYDPIFFDPEAGKTAAQMEPAEKNSRSHRGKAVAMLLEKWRDFAAG